MTIFQNTKPSLAAFLRAHQPEGSVLFFSQKRLKAQLVQFQTGFPGLVTYAVKANPADEVLQVLVEGGMQAFDVASVPEIDAVQDIASKAALHFNNPVRMRSEIIRALAKGVRSFSVDRVSELDKLMALCLPEDTEITVRFKLPVPGAVYDFGDKFGADPALAVEMLARVKRAGYRTSLGFHPGTQCANASPWVSYIEAAAGMASQAGVAVERLNIGGGFPSARNGTKPDIAGILSQITDAWRGHFPNQRPGLVCEPGRAMVGDAMDLAVPVRAVDGGTLFLNDGRYGVLTEFADIGAVTRIEVPGRSGTKRPFQTFGPTCDSLDKLPEPLILPDDIQEGDHVIFKGMGAYSSVLCTPFNGFGTCQIVPMDLD